MEMKAITRESYGGPEVLEVRSIPRPKVKANEILIRVQYATVNRTDCGILEGKPFLMRFFTGLPKPSSKVPGSDFSGEVVEVGSEVRKFSKGDRVWGLSDEGLASHAAYMVIRENKGVEKIPEGISFQEAVACAEGGHYAYNFVNKIKLSKEAKVLVNGATGAIGSAALQILKNKGVYVTAVGNTENLELLKKLGADKVYNYEKEDFTAIDSDLYDFVFDAVGKSSFGKCKHLLLPKGVYISSELGPNAQNLYLPLITRMKGGKRVIFPIPKNCKESLVFLNDLLRRKKWVAVIDRYYRPEAIKEAYAYVQSGQKTGNVLLDFSEDAKTVTTANEG